MSGPLVTGLPVSVPTSSAQETSAIGAAVARWLHAGDVVLLVGSLGAGKTTFVKGLVAALGGGDTATSPTFTLAHSYPTTPPVTHVDLWRLERLQEVVDLALEEDLDSGGVVLAEWGDAAEPLYGADALTVRIGWGPTDDDRIISLEGRGGTWQSRVEAMSAVLWSGAAGAGPGAAGTG